MSDSTYRLSSPVIFQVKDVAINSVPHIHRRWPCWRLQPNKKTHASRSSPWHHSNYIRTSIAHFVQHVPLSSYSAQPLPLCKHMHSTAFRIGVGSACTYKRVHVCVCVYVYVGTYIGTVCVCISKILHIYLSRLVLFQVQNVAIDSVPDIHHRWPCWRLQPNNEQQQCVH